MLKRQDARAVSVSVPGGGGSTARVDEWLSPVAAAVSGTAKQAAAAEETDAADAEDADVEDEDAADQAVSGKRADAGEGDDAYGGALVSDPVRTYLRRMATVGVAERPEHTLEVGRDLTATRECIRQIETKAPRKLRLPLRGKALRPFSGRLGFATRDHEASDDFYAASLRTLLALNNVELDFGALLQQDATRVVRVYEDILAAAVRRDEPKTLRCVEELDRAFLHGGRMRHPRRQSYDIRKNRRPGRGRLDEVL